MLPSESPFTNEADLKELPHTLDGSFAWLTKTPRHREWAIGDAPSKLPAQLKSIVASAKSHGIGLPKEFVAFIRTPALRDHLRSVTACYLDVAESLLPFANGFLVRFLADQQGGAFWYMYKSNDALNHCVVSSLKYFDADEMDYELDDLRKQTFSSRRFRSLRFSRVSGWRNEIQFARNGQQPRRTLIPRSATSCTSRLQP